MSSRQTLSFLRRRFEEAGITPVTRHGQNFLIDLNLVELLVESAQLTRHDVVLEVGTGTGSLTALIARRAAKVISVEIDRHLHQLAREHLAEFDNVTLLLQDALRNKNHFQPDLLELIADQLRQTEAARFKLVANLPYNIATPVISNLLSTPIVPHSMTVTVQKELADRMRAAPNSKDYGALSVWLQSQCDIEIIRELPPDVFWPKPKVASTILRIVVNEARRAAIPDRAYFHDFSRAVFLHRRKLLRSVLIYGFKSALNKSDVDRVLEETGIDPTSRAEQLDWPNLLRLCESIRAVAPRWRLR